jgi:hypothetical protein
MKKVLVAYYLSLSNSYRQPDERISKEIKEITNKYDKFLERI